jgi:outer membrane protein OmpA-like peptidoglycan-associated protein
MRWNPKTVSADEPSKFTVYYGGDSLQSLNVNHHRKETVKADEVYFAVAKSDLTPASKKTLDALLKDAKISYVTVEGFTDQTGSPESNFKLSQGRVNSVKDYLVNTLKVDASVILFKSHGAFFANTSKAKESDRKVVVTLYLK